MCLYKTKGIKMVNDDFHAILYLKLFFFCKIAKFWNQSMKTKNLGNLKTILFSHGNRNNI